MAYAETTNNALCILSLDFKAAFDNTSHTYLFTMLKAYGFSDEFQQRIKTMYEGATSSVQINGHISSSIPIQCSIRQGCPLSVQLFALCLNPPTMHARREAKWNLAKGRYTLVTLPRNVTPYRDSVDETCDHVTYQKLVTRLR